MCSSDLVGEVNLATLESSRCAGLQLVGELLDVDGVTGGFNFQHCWTSGWLAGQALQRALMVSVPCETPHRQLSRPSAEADA